MRPGEAGGILQARRLLALIVVWLAGCTSTLHVPAPDDPALVYLIDHGRHPSLVLPDGRGGAVRYAYGDWSWFAEGKTGFLQGVAALAWPTPAALGRQELDVWRKPAALRRSVPEGFVSLYPVEVPRAAASRLEKRLAQRYFERRDRALHNPAFGLTFVPHPEPYWLGNNSNLVAARWLEALGVEVSGVPILSRWKLASAQTGRFAIGQGD